MKRSLFEGRGGEMAADPGSLGGFMNDKMDIKL